MADRTAIDTLRGYFYQFDFTIATVLNLSQEDQSINVESIEDVDINSATEITAIQCKYYQKTEYNHSVISEAVRWMLSHYKDSIDGKVGQINYKLLGHYKSGHSKLELPLTLQYLKENFLTYSRKKMQHFHHVELGLDDVQLEKFIDLIEIDINAKEFEQQFSDVIKLLKSQFKCSEFIAENYFYNNALRIVRNLSKEADIDKRKISKREFLSSIDNSGLLFNEWFVQKKGAQTFYNSLRKEYFGDLNILDKNRVFLIEVDASTYLRSDIKDILYTLIRKYSKITKQPSPFCPYVYVHGIEPSELIEIKTDLLSENIIINDGFDFEGASFSPNSLLKKPNTAYPIKLKFLNKIQHLEQLISAIKAGEIYQFYLNNEFYFPSNASIKHTKIQLEKLVAIKQII